MGNSVVDFQVCYAIPLIKPSVVLYYDNVWLKNIHCFKVRDLFTADLVLVV